MKFASLDRGEPRRVLRTRAEARGQAVGVSGRHLQPPPPCLCHCGHSSNPDQSPQRSIHFLKSSRRCPLALFCQQWPMTQAAAASRVVAARWRQSSLSNLSGLGQEPFAHSSGYRLGLHICLGFLVGLVYRGRALRAHCNCPRGNRSRIKGHGQLDGRAWLLCAKYTCLV